MPSYLGAQENAPGRTRQAPQRLLGLLPEASLYELLISFSSEPAAFFPGGADQDPGCIYIDLIFM
jgi:hypothetical protein